MIIAVTGHQSGKIEMPTPDLEELFALTFLEAEPEAVIVGMADGADLIAGMAAIFTAFPVWAVIPWAGHKKSKYCVDCQEQYDFVEHFAQKVIVLDDSEEYPGPSAFHNRNHYMVDNATHVLAYWNGAPRSGTGATVNYALKNGVPVRNLYEQTI